MAKASRANPPQETSPRAPAASRGAIPSPPVETVPQIPWRIAFALLALLAILVLWFPLSRMGVQYATNYNEGFNTQMAHAAISGVRLYGAPPLFVYTTYPPLSFYLIGVLGKLTGDINAAGRWISLLGFFGVAVLLAGIVRRLTGRLRFAAYAALCFVIWIAAYKSDRVGMNDPQFLGMALSVAGLYCYVRDPASSKWLRWSAVLFALAMFSKQTIATLPCAVGIQLLLTDRKRLVAWLTAGAVAGFTLLIPTFAIGGPYFFTNLLLPRIHTYDLLMANVAFYLMFFQIPLVSALVWSLWEPRGIWARPSSLGVLAFAVGNALGFVLCSSGGSDWNHLFDAILALALVAGLALPGVEKAVQGLAWRDGAFTVLLVVPFFYTSWILLPQRIGDDAAASRSTAQLEKEFAAGADFLKARPGPVLCENLLLCYAAGKPMTYDNFAVEQLVKTGTLPEQRLIRMIDFHEYPTIQLDIAAGEPIEPAARQGFSAAFMGELLARYRPAMRTSGFVVFVGK